MAKTAAKQTGAQVIRLPQQKAPNVTVKMQAPAKKKGGHRRGHGAGGVTIEDMGKSALAGLVLGYVDKNPGSIPTVPMLGRAGTLALACYYFRKSHPMLSKMALGFAAIASYEWQKEGSVSGREGVAASM